MDLTIYIPTKNRHYFIMCLVEYYAHQKFTGCLCILDSSDNFINLNSILQTKRLPFQIKHIHEIGWPHQLIKKYSSDCETKYATFTGDDDFLTVVGICRAIERLDTSDEFISACGLSLILTLTKNGNLLGIADYKLFNETNPNPLERVRSLFSDYKVPLFSIYRKEIFELAFQSVAEISKLSLCPERIINDELVAASMLAASGKVYYFEDALYLLRIDHSARYLHAINDLEESDEFKISRGYLIEKLILFFRCQGVISDGILQAEITKIVNSYFASLPVKRSMDSKYLLDSIKSEVKMFLIDKMAFKFLDHELERMNFSNGLLVCIQLEIEGILRLIREYKAESNDLVKMLQLLDNF